jgi:phosphate transport system protein
MDQQTHLQERIERDIEGLRSRLRKMADMVLDQLQDSVRAFADSNRSLAYMVVLRDHSIDVLESHIDRLCQEFLVRHMPVSEQLRFAVACAKVNSELERIGDYAEAIARRVVALSASGDVAFREPIVKMSVAAFQMLSQAVDAFLERNPDQALQILESDREVDRMNSDLFHALARPDSGPSSLEVRFGLLGLANRLERVADRACNIAEEAVYVSRGQVLRHLPREDMRVLFLCEANASRSQMAEGIARQQAPQHFLFRSAGVNPTSVDPRAVEFMARQGIDISRQQAKSVAAVGPIEDFNIVVTLSHQAEETCPQVPYQVVQLNWEIGDPSDAAGTDEEIERAYREVYEDLGQRIHDLVEALSGAFEQEEEE